MPKLLKESNLAEAIQKRTFLLNAVDQNVEGIKYDFCTGERYLKASFGQPISIDKLTESERAGLQVDPGEVVFALTHEQVALPGNMMALLSPKRSLAHQGILILGGLAVDPNYAGPLWVGLYNFSSTPFKLRPGIKLVAGMFYELAPEESVPTVKSKPVSDFPDELILLIRNYKPVELRSILDQLHETRRELQDLKADLSTDKDWKDEFKKSLDEHNKQLGQLIEGLKEERDARKTEDAGIKIQLDQMRDWAAVFKSGWAIAAIVIAAALGALFAWLATPKAPAPVTTTLVEEPAPPDDASEIRDSTSAKSKAERNSKR